MDAAIDDIVVIVRINFHVFKDLIELVYERSEYNTNVDY